METEGDRLPRSSFAKRICAAKSMRGFVGPLTLIPLTGVSGSPPSGTDSSTTSSPGPVNEDSTPGRGPVGRPAHNFPASSAISRLGDACGEKRALRGGIFDSRSDGGVVPVSDGSSGKPR